jgi:hypothetical protein
MDIFYYGYLEGNVTWKICVGQSKGYAYDSCHAFWRGRVSRDFMDIIHQVPILNPTDTENLGFTGLPSWGWGDDPPYFNTGVSLSWDTTDPIYQQNLAMTIMVADTLRLKGIHWLVINFPLSPNYQHIAAYSAGGPSKQTAHEIIQNMRDLEGANRFFHFYDANIDGNHDYAYEDFFDEYHLSGQGAARLSRRVDSIIHTIIP